MKEITSFQGLEKSTNSYQHENTSFQKNKNKQKESIPISRNELSQIDQKNSQLHKTN